MTKMNTGSAVAPRRSREEWALEVARWRESGLGSTEYAASRGIRRSTLLWWSCQLGSEASRSKARPSDRGAVAFLPVRVRERAVDAHPPVKAARGRVEIVLGNGRRVRVVGEFDSAILARVLEIRRGGEPMLTLPPSVRIFIAAEPVDARKSYDGLSALVESHFGHDLLEGHLYGFINRRAEQIQILFWDRNGRCIVKKRLEAGTFRLVRRPGGEATHVEIDAAELALMLEGIELDGAKRRKRYRRDQHADRPEK